LRLAIPGTLCHDDREKLINAFCGTAAVLSDLGQGFDLAEHWERSTEAYERSIERFPITIRLAPERLDAFAGIAGSRIMAAATRTPDPDYPELVRLRVAFDWMDEAVGAVLRMGADAEVLEPEWLRQSILAAAQAIIARYSSESVAALPG
jgi:predicted DNA-binding transcriptional regulator YafY